jgi:hypothetical protein
MATTTKKTDDAKPDDGPVTVELADENPQTFHDVTALVAKLGGTVAKVSGRKLTVDLPPGPDREPGRFREHLVAGLLADPQVKAVA